jgi:hypothetical protein
MAKVLKTVAIVASVIALSLAIPGVGTAIGLTAATTASVVAIASVVATVASLGAQMLTKPPPARGSETKIQIGVETPSPYLMGTCFSAGILRHDTGYGATLKKVPNPYRGMVVVYSVAGPLTSCNPQVDFGSVSSYYTGFLYTDTQLGASPEATALSPHFAGMPGWGSSSKLSGQAAILWNMLFDKDGKRFASGVPNLGAIWQGVKVYDPRLDSTYPGGSGSHRITDESTWTYSANPALHAIAYAYGRRQNGKKVFGIGQPVAGIDLPRFVAWANVCDANGWEIAGTIYEPANRWDNLKEIMQAGCAEPVATGGMLSVRYRAPQVAVATLTEDDLADDDFTITAMQSYRNRINGIIPKYRSQDHNWEFVSASKVSVPTYVTEDGEIKDEERQWNLVKDVDQVAELAAYALVDARELGPIEVTVKPEWRIFKPGECIEVDLPSLEFSGDAIILQREIDPATMKVKLTLIGETPAKHAYALGQTGTPPPTPALGQTSEERDDIALSAADPPGFLSQLVLSSYVTDADPLDGLMQATDASITIEAHTRNYSDKSVSVTGDTLTEDVDSNPLSADTLYHIYYDDGGRQGGVAIYHATTIPADAANSAATPFRHYLGSIKTDVVGGTGTVEGGQIPPGWQEGKWYEAL